MIKNTSKMFFTVFKSETMANSKPICLVGSVFTNKPLKYVTNGNVIQLLVEARDWGDPVRSTVTSVDIVVLDANDHTPLFQHDAYTVSPLEDTPVGTTLLTLWAEDLDWE